MYRNHVILLTSNGYHLWCINAIIYDALAWTYLNTIYDIVLYQLARSIDNNNI